MSLTTNERPEATFHAPPWQGLGTSIPKDASPMEALKKARLDWTVRKEPLYRTNLEQARDVVAICRTDDDSYLGTVGKNFSPIQNIEQARFLEALCTEGVRVVNCGAIANGRRTFWCVQMPENLIVGPNDEVERYFIVANGHDGSMSFRAFWTPVRLVCQNMLNAALRRSQNAICLRHTPKIKNRIEQAKRVLRMAGEYYAALGEQFRKLRSVSMNDEGFQIYLDAVLPVPTDKEPTAQLVRARGSVSQNWQAGLGMSVAGRTAWAAYNAVTEYTSHQSPLRGGRPERRFENVLVGSGRVLQQKAFEAATKIAGIN